MPRAYGVALSKTRRRDCSRSLRSEEWLVLLLYVMRQLKVLDERRRRLQCAIQARIPTEANFSSRLALRLS